MLKGQTRVQALWHLTVLISLQRMYSMDSTKVFIKDIFRTLIIKLYKLREKDQEIAKWRKGGNDLKKNLRKDSY